MSEMICPFCGSHDWSATEIAEGTLGEVRCEDCGELLKES